MACVQHQIHVMNFFSVVFSIQVEKKSMGLCTVYDVGAPEQRPCPFTLK